MRKLVEWCAAAPNSDSRASAASSAKFCARGDSRRGLRSGGRGRVGGDTGCGRARVLECTGQSRVGGSGLNSGRQVANGDVKAYIGEILQAWEPDGICSWELKNENPAVLPAAVWRQWSGDIAIAYIVYSSAARDHIPAAVSSGAAQEARCPESTVGDIQAVTTHRLI